MGNAKSWMIAAGFGFFQATGLHRLAQPWTQGHGAILMFHHVRPWRGDAFAPNRLLEITPEFLARVVRRVRDLGFDILSLDDALAALANGAKRPFVTLTFDDGYKDFRAFALPVLERHRAPFTQFVTTGFADGTARLWWIELEEAVRALLRVKLDVAGEVFNLPAETAAEKSAAFQTLYRRLRAGPEDVLRAAIADLCLKAQVEARTIAPRLCLDWREIEDLAAHPLCTVGAHTLTHPMLAKQSVEVARRELTQSRRILEARLDRPVRHVAYPVGDLSAATARDYALAAEAGFSSGVTTRPGMLFGDHRARLMALPRLSINGNWQSLDSLEVLLSGLPFLLWNRGRRVALP